MNEVLNQGAEYLQKIQDLALTSGMINSLDYSIDQQSTLRWISTHIASVNAVLQTDLEKCAECWRAGDRPSVQIFAAPIAAAYPIDGCCNFSTTPVTLLIDVGRVIPSHWLHVVVHEYAHACVGSGGHGPEFARILAHLCLGMGLPMPDRLTPEYLQSFPPCTATVNALAFWQGKAQPSA